MSDSSAIDAALVALLSGDAPLMAICTDGVWFDDAPQDAAKFVRLSLIVERDEPEFGGRAFEDALYLVMAVVKDGSGADAKSAAARIEALLEDNQTLTATGYTRMAVFREERIRLLEVDDQDPTIRWQHRGGRYRVQFSV